ncbi:MAG: hypothetical protein HC900_08880, partial [Methylacidiphilales bacterium]|nr:hypothetical protein [Candidatus Methylacidiphilales bacterium]
MLVAAGVVGRDAYTRHLAAWLGLPFAELDGAEEAGDPPPQVQALAAGFMAVKRTAAGLLVALAPQGLRIRGLIRLVRTQPDVGKTLCLTSPERLERFVLRRAGPRLAEAAAFGMQQRAPELSAAARGTRRFLPVLPMAAAAVAA